MADWQTLGSKTVYSNPYWTVEERAVIRPNGQRGKYYMLHANPFCAIIPITTNGEIYLIQQFRYPLQRTAWEIPQGLNDGEDLLVAAKRELQEETGLSAAEWKQLGTLPSDKGATDEIGHIFIARDLTQTDRHEQAEEGITGCNAFSIAEIKNMIRRGDIYDDFTIAALYLAELHGELA